MLLQLTELSIVVCLSVTVQALPKRLHRSRCRLGCGLRWAL